MIASLLIANRGEIACRIIRTARRLNIRTVAVYSDADAQAPHVLAADEAVHIGPSPVRESYLLGEKILAAAQATGAEAIHPGYGFLSENAGFAQAVTDGGLVWVGPKPSSITAMGLKDAAKALMADAGVPVTPGYMGENQDADFLAGQAGQIGYPVLIKAVAGGGGKGMRLVTQAEEFADALLSCQREAASSFGNDHVLIEKYIQRPRHIEVQVFGDQHGNIVHLFERDCSLQRRHQKVIEEAPAPGMDAATREALCAAAVRAAQAVDYVGAGTIEFIADASEGLRADRIWFMEMNTRLQVEHPVTEEITGQDLVEWQLRVASGEPLPLRQDELSITGWAMEARLYAENPSNGFLPSTGPLERLRLPTDGVRSDSGVVEGGEVTGFYDPMIAKLIVHAESREEAGRALARAAAQVQVWPVRTNAAFLARAANDPDFLAGAVDTGFIERHAEALIPATDPDETVVAAAAAEVLAWATPGPLKLAGFRANADPVQQVRVQVGAATHSAVPQACPGAEVVRLGGDAIMFMRGEAWPIGFARRDAGGGAGGASDGAILSPMPGRIISLDVQQGDAVIKGQKLLVMEAMKMEQALVAPFDGVVTELNATSGGQVAEGIVLARIERGEG